LERDRVETVMGMELRVESLETDVMRMVAAQSGLVTRCASFADASLSLSLSLLRAF
jgi:hypothetical protein